MDNRGLTIGAGIVTGSIIGFVRVALTAYLLGTHSQADSLAVAVGPLDALNSVLINTMVFAFVPMLAAYQKYVDLNPTDAALAWRNFGIVLSNANRMKEALEPLQKATTIAPHPSR